MSRTKRPNGAARRVEVVADAREKLRRAYMTFSTDGLRWDYCCNIPEAPRCDPVAVLTIDGRRATLALDALLIGIRDHVAALERRPVGSLETGRYGESGHGWAALPILSK
jgi:hypothetical protein